MKQKILTQPTLLTTLAVDALLLLAAALVPALSHATALPLYQLNPLLLMLLLAQLLLRTPGNAYLMAILLPSFSALLTGFPLPGKLFCMIPEYLTVVLLLQTRLAPARSQRPVAQFGAVLLALLAGKAVYYLLKALLLAPAQLVTTPWGTQLLVLLLFALGYLLLRRTLSGDKGEC